MDKAKEIKEKMDACGIAVSAIGSPIGKIGINDEFEPHFEKYKHIVELAHYFETPNIRMFSFYLPDENLPEKYRDKSYGAYGETGGLCKTGSSYSFA